ncbi:MAG: alpha/beta fold hydrolase [Chloroflexi bacterium]|nr:alpha/beta fold hydrolase [Chloroflexota bacterium]
MESKFVQTPSGKFHAMVAGAGEPVLLIHGYTSASTWRVWEKNISALAEHNCVYAMDMIGYGESDKRQVPVDAPGQARALIELLDAENLEHAGLIGLSWGGGIAQIVATAAPKRVNRLVLVDSSYSQKQERLALLKKIECPALIVWDEDDAVIPVAGAQMLANAIPNSRVRIFKREERDPDADPENRHWSQMTHSKEWNRVVGEFLTRGK